MIVATTGFFDGVHRGHRYVLDRIVKEARARCMESAVITFWPHPRSVLQQDADELRLLTSIDEKKRLIESAGIDKVYVLEFTKEFSRLSAEEFLRGYIKERFNVSVFVVGYDHRFGRTDGPAVSIRDLCSGYGIECINVPPFSEGDVVFSSTKIRNLLHQGKIEAANEMLGYRYCLSGVVVPGKRIGRKIGFPTANMELSDPRKMVPANGVYFVLAEISGKPHRGICNIGPRPTVDDGENVTIETHIIGFDEDIYGLDIRVGFVSKMRDVAKFSSLEELASQLEIDRRHAESFGIPGLPFADPVFMRGME